MPAVQVGRLARGSRRAEYGRAVGCCPNYVVPAVGRNSHHPRCGARGISVAGPAWQSSVERLAERWPSRPSGPGASHVAVSRPD